MMALITKNTMLVLILLSLLLFWPSSNDCECIGVSSKYACFGISGSCKDTKLQVGEMDCEPSSCDEIKNYLSLEDSGEPGFVNLDITIIIDRSGSMEGDALENAKTALKKLVDLTRPDDRIAIIRFNEQATLAQQFSSNKVNSKNTVESLVAWGYTKYIPALQIALDNYASQGSKRKKLVIFVSDGEPDDKGRPQSIFSMVKLLSNQDICIHTVGYGNAVTPGSAAERVLKESAQISNSITGCGSYHFAPESGDALKQIFVEIYNDLMKKGALTITPKFRLEDELVHFDSAVTSTINKKVLPGESAYGCALPATLTADIQKNGVDIRKININYTNKGYTLPISDLDRGKYDVWLTATTKLNDETVCPYRGTGKTTLELKKPYGDNACSSSCSAIADYLSQTTTESLTMNVNITDKKFVPASVRIPDKTTVRWTNIGSKPHKVSSDIFESETLKPGESFEYYFEESQTIEYYDNTTPMVGYVQEYAFDWDDQIDVVLAVDTSGSMAGRKLDEAKIAATRFSQMLYKSDRAAIITFDDIARVNLQFTNNKDSLKNALEKLYAGEGTNYIPALEASTELFKSYSSPDVKRLVIFLSDGQPWDGDDIINKTRELIDNGICLYTVGYGEAVQKGSKAEKILKEMALISKNDKRCGEYYYSVRSAEKLAQIFGEIYKEIILQRSIMVDLDVNKEKLGENDSLKVSARVKSVFNKNYVPGFAFNDDCAPSAHVKTSIFNEHDKLVAEKVMNYKDGVYSIEMSDLPVGKDRLVVDAQLLNGAGELCNYYGLNETTITVMPSEDSVKSHMITLTVMFSILLSLVVLFLGISLLTKKNK